MTVIATGPCGVNCTWRSCVTPGISSTGWPWAGAARSAATATRRPRRPRMTPHEASGRSRRRPSGGAGRPAAVVASVDPAALAVEREPGVECRADLCPEPVVEPLHVEARLALQQREQLWREQLAL